MDPPQVAPIRHARLALFWALLGAMATVAVLPYLLTLLPAVRQRIVAGPLPLAVVVALQFLQSLALLFALSWIGLRLGKSVGLDSPFARAWVYRTPTPPLRRGRVAFAVVGGLLAGGFVVVADLLVFLPLMPAARDAAGLHPARWKGLLACFYGGIVEELLLRLFVMTLLVRLLMPLLRYAAPHRHALAYVAAAIVSALLFGAGHLPAAAHVWPLTAVVVTRVVVLNAVPGVLYGLLYWQAGLEHAMLSHGCSDLVLHVIVGA